jgi:large subunit ribosomal protein L5
MKTAKQNMQSAYEAMKDTFGYKNRLAAPRLQKIVISVGTGAKMKADRTKNDFIMDRIAKITGQKPTLRKAKQSIASFKIRQGDPIGVAVTLRGARMEAFLDKLINIAFPRTKDFRGIERSKLDNIGNLTIGIKEHTIFPETGGEELKDVFGLSMAFVTTAKTKKEAEAYFVHLGMPFKK